MKDKSRVTTSTSCGSPGRYLRFVRSMTETRLSLRILSATYKFSQQDYMRQQRNEIMILLLIYRIQLILKNGAFFKFNQTPKRYYEDFFGTHQLLMINWIKNHTSKVLLCFNSLIHYSEILMLKRKGFDSNEDKNRTPFTLYFAHIFSAESLFLSLRRFMDSKD